MAKRHRPALLLLPAAALVVAGAACDDAATTATGGAASASSSGGPGPTTTTDASSSSTGMVVPAGLAGKLEETRFVTSDATRAAVELRLAGEPLARLLGRDLRGYDGASATPDTYTDPVRGAEADPLGFALAIEAPEVSAAAARALSSELGAGISAQFGPLLNPTQATGDASFTALRDRVAAFAVASRATGMKAQPDLVVVPAPVDLVNPYGFPGVYPVFAEYRSFTTDVVPVGGADHACNIARSPLAPVYTAADYECDATSLSLSSHDGQSEEVLAPDALGFAAWNQALTAARALGLHDANEIAITKVGVADVAAIGAAGNTVVGQYPDPADPTGTALLDGAAGTFLGTSAIDGFQALLAIQALDEKASLLLASLLTGDGAALGGDTVSATLAYDYAAPLRWWPAGITVTETATAAMPEEERKLFPQPTTLAIADKRSRLVDLSGLLAAYATVYAMTDASNPAFGADPALRAVFDGSPFASDNGLADGEATLHDRALAIVKMALVDVDRIHVDAGHGAIVDASSIFGGVATLGGELTTASAATSIVALRTAYRGLTGKLLRDANDVPDLAGQGTALDATSLGGAPFQGPLGPHIQELIRLQADAIRTKLIGATGVLLNGYDVANGLPDLSTSTLLGQASGLRAMLEAHLALGDAKYLDSAKFVYAALESKLWNPDVRMYRSELGESSKMTYDPATLGALVGALRVYRVVVASLPGAEAEAAEVDARLLRVLKVVVNGWNDLDEDGVIDDGECLAGRMLMGERSRTGELGVAADKGDRDGDCVPDIATAKRPALLGAKLVLTKKLL